MVYLSKYLFRKHGSFLDTLRIFVKGGTGGSGLPKYGGVGGKGGDVYAEARDKLTLRKIKHKFPSQRFIATPGDDSKRHCVLGNPGKDVIIKCPTGVTVITDTKQILGELNNIGDTVLIAKGGSGGCRETDYIGQKGQAHSVQLDLKLLADVGFVGFPNAGKSTLLRALSHAKPKVASYPFTTIQPTIGILEYEDHRKISAADLPGLIEGAYLNYGMGHKFLKHCDRTKVLLFVVDLHGFQLNHKQPFRTALQTILFLNQELELFDPELLNKPAILALNKIDTEGSIDLLKDIKDRLHNLKDSVSDSGLPPEEQYKIKQFVSFDAVVPISAKQRLNIKELKSKLRTIIDIYHDKKLDETMKNSDSNEMTISESSVIYV